MAFTITRGPICKAQKVVVYGPEGIGKTSFAADFPEPLFIDTEDGSNMFDVARLPKPTSWTMLKQEVQEVIHDKPCKTLVIDTIDWAELLCVAHLLSIYQKDSIEDFSYGKGYILVYEEMGRLLNLFSDVINAGINVVLTAHATLYKFEEPNEQGAYDRYTLKLTQKTTSAKVVSMVKEWADLVLFANYKTLTITDSKTKKTKAAGGKRVMYTTHHPNWDAKNRHDLADELPFEFASIAVCLSPLPSNVVTAPTVPLKGKPAVVNTILEEKLAPPKSEQEEIDNLAAKEYITRTKSLKINQALKDLMLQDLVAPKEIQTVVATKGYFPIDMEIESYPEDFVQGCLIGAWPQVIQIIKKNRDIPF